MMAAPGVRAAPAGRSRPHGSPPIIPDEAVLARMRLARAARVISEVRLDETMAPRVLAIFAAYDARELALASEKRVIVREIRTELGATRPRGPALSKAIDRLLEVQGRRRQLRNERLDDLRRALSPVQQARLLLILPRLDRDLARSVSEAIDAGRRPCDPLRDEGADRSICPRGAGQARP
jgi:hypothetical protein